MFCAKVVVPNPAGLHARPAAGLVQLCKGFSSKILILHGSSVINAKSIVNLLAGGLTQNTEIELQITGEDEDAAGAALLSYIQGLTD